MSNGKRPECWRCPECGGMWLENADEEIGVTVAMVCGPCDAEMRRVGLVLPVSTLESLAQELEGRAEAEQELRDRALSYGAVDPIDAVGAAVHAAARDALREAARLVRAVIEEGDRG